MPCPYLPALIAALALSGCAGGLDLFGGSGPPGETAAARETCPGVTGFDIDASGAVTPEEFTRSAGRLFPLWDDTDDGLLSANEFNDCLGPNAEDLFVLFDINSNRMIEPAEFTSLAPLTAWDGDGDGLLSEDELTASGFLAD